MKANRGRSHGHGHDKGEHGEHEGSKEGEEDSEEVVESEGEQHEDGQEGGDQGSDGDSNEGEGTSDNDSTKSGSDDQSRPDHSVLDAGQGSPDKPRGEDPKATGSYEMDSGSNTEGVRFKGATSGGTEEGVQGDTRKHIPDAKGGAKKRIESDYGKMQGVLNEDDPESTDKPAGSKMTSSPNQISAKQHGLSNTQTKHSTDLDNNPEKSKKGEGYVETAKAQGTVDPGRPQV
ncbi:MAG: hypothetical protein Q9181_001159 [Wetmoreana brouardii]